jgi:hypothetical protein
MPNKIIVVEAKAVRELTCAKCGGEDIKTNRNFALRIEACEGWEFEQNNGWDLFGLDFTILKAYKDEIEMISDCKTLKLEYLHKKCGGRDFGWKKQVSGSYGSRQ